MGLIHLANVQTQPIKLVFTEPVVNRVLPHCACRYWRYGFPVRAFAVKVKEGVEIQTKPRPKFYALFLVKRCCHPLAFHAAKNCFVFAAGIFKRFAQNFD